MIYTSFSPNTRPKDLRLNVTLLNKLSRWMRGDYPDRVTKLFSSWYGGAVVLPFNYARSALYLHLESLQFSPNDEVVVQAFTCVAVPNAVKWAGAKVRYVDINERTLSLDIEKFRKALSPRTRAVILQYTFGLPGPVGEVLDIAREKNFVVIEDCANVINPSFPFSSDAAIFSFGRDKVVSGVDGGVLVVNNPALVEPVQKLYDDIPYPPRLWVWRELLYPLLWEAIKFGYDSGWGKLVNFIATRMKLLSRATTAIEKRGIRPRLIPARLPNALAALAYQQLKDIDQLNAHRRRISQIYWEGLRDIPELKIWAMPEEHALLRFPVLAERRDELKDFLRQRRILVGDWYEVPVAPQEVSQVSAGYQWGSCPVAESICRKIINLPTHINVNEEQARVVVDKIKEFYRAKTQ